MFCIEELKMREHVNKSFQKDNTMKNSTERNLR